MVGGLCVGRLSVCRSVVCVLVGRLCVVVTAPPECSVYDGMQSQAIVESNMHGLHGLHIINASRSTCQLHQVTGGTYHKLTRCY